MEGHEDVEIPQIIASGLIATLFSRCALINLHNATNGAKWPSEIDI